MSATLKLISTKGAYIEFHQSFLWGPNEFIGLSYRRKVVGYVLCVCSDSKAAVESLCPGKMMSLPYSTNETNFPEISCPIYYRLFPR